jgi:hypothetical protein
MCPSTREVMQAALASDLINDGKPIRVRLLPGLTIEEVDEFSQSLLVPPPDDVRDLLQFCSGIDDTLEQLDFTGKSLGHGFEADFLPGGSRSRMTDTGTSGSWTCNQGLRRGGPSTSAVMMRRCCSCRL